MLSYDTVKPKFGFSSPDRASTEILEQLGIFLQKSTFSTFDNRLKFAKRVNAVDESCHFHLRSTEKICPLSSSQQLEMLIHVFGVFFRPPVYPTVIFFVIYYLSH